MQWITEETGWILPEESGFLPDDRTGGQPAPEELIRLGAALAEASPRCMVGYEPDSGKARADAMLLAGAAASAGGPVILVPDCAPAELGQASRAGTCGLVLFAGADRLRMYAGGLLPVTKQQAESLKAAAAREPVWRGKQETGSISEGKALRLLYPAQILARMPAECLMKPECSSASGRIRTLAEQVFRGGSGEELTVQLSADGRRVSVYAERVGWLFWEQLLLMRTQHCLLHGEDAALPYWVPHTAELMAKRAGRRILRYASRSDGSDREARALAISQGFTLDGLALTADILRIQAEEEPDLKRWAESLPPCKTVRRILYTDAAGDAAARCGTVMRTVRTPEGLRVSDRRGAALLRPSASGKTLTMLVEAMSAEAASELAGDIASLISAKRD